MVRLCMIEVYMQETDKGYRLTPEAHSMRRELRVAMDEANHRRR